MIQHPYYNGTIFVAADNVMKTFHLQLLRALDPFSHLTLVDCLRRVVGDQRLTYKKLPTVLSTETCLNLQPLCPLTAYVLEVLTSA